MRGLLLLVPVIVLCGCDRLFGLDTVTQPSVDASVDAVDAALPCFGVGPGRVCLLALPTQPIIVDAPTTIDTSSFVCVPYAGTTQPYCVVSATDIQISGTLRTTGSKPLVLVATTIAITSTGTIDVSSNRAPMSIGPGSEPIECTPVAAPAASGGGPGGTLGGRGGAGGIRSGVGSPIVAASLTTIASVRGGCAGKAGTTGVGGGFGGTGGAGGGAIYLIANSIQIDGIIDASGAGGSGGRTNTGFCCGGGGGGGAGGLIGLDAPAITIAATSRVFANGGGGGEGAASGADAVAASGSDPGTSSAGSQAPGGGGIFVHGGEGGSGAGGSVLAGTSGSTDTESGGGGGGGAGVIWIIAPSPMVMSGSILSPAPTSP